MSKKQLKGKDFYKSQLHSAYKGLERSAYVTHVFLRENQIFWKFLRDMQEALDAKYDSDKTQVRTIEDLMIGLLRELDEKK